MNTAHAASPVVEKKVRKPRKRAEVKVTMTCIGRKEVSKEALERFVDLYFEMIERTEGDM